MNNPFSIKESFSFAWKTFTSRPWFLIAAVAGMVLISLIASYIPLVSIVVGILVDMGLVAFALAAYEDVHALEWKTLWAPHPFWQYVGATMLTALIVLVGIILLIIPGIIAMVGLMFVKYLVMDRQLGPVEAIKESWRITKGNRWNLFGFMLVVMLLNIAGALAFMVGLLVTVPLTMLAMVYAYRTLEHEAHEVAPAGEVAPAQPQDAAEMPEAKEEDAPVEEA